MTKALPLLLLTALFAYAAEKPPNHRTAEETQQGYTLLFNGRTLAGWDGDPRLWRVEDGAIVGSSHEHSITQNTFLIHERPFSDFILRLELKLRNGKRHRSLRFEVPPGWVTYIRCEGRQNHFNQ